MKKLILSTLLLCAAGLVHAQTGFLVAAPDRGFLGNEETRDAVGDFLRDYPAELVFVTDERTELYFRRAVAALQERDVEKIVVLPFYISAAHPDLALLAGYAKAAALPMDFGRVFGASVPAVSALGDRLTTVPHHAQTVVVVGEGARTEQQAADMRSDYQRLFAAAADRFHFGQREVLISREDGDLQQELAALSQDSVVVPFHLGAKYDGMMSHTAWLRYAAPDSLRILDGGVAPHPAIDAWLRREAARYLPENKFKLGVIVHAHGADFHWNERMRAAAAPLAEDYLVEYAFSMGDPVTLQRAVERLVARGAQGVVIVRVFSMANSFLPGIERFIGTGYENCKAPEQGMHMHHGTPAPRLLTTVPVVTTGGLQDNPLFAAALLDRARQLSKQPTRETVILVAHGKGDDVQNAAWLELLASLRKQMLAKGGDMFRAIEIGTWREDWPDKRTAAVAHIRDLIAQAQQDGGRAVVIPTRTNAQGPARELIPDMDYALGEGFAPHPLFVEWLREQARHGMDLIRYQPDYHSCGVDKGTSDLLPRSP